MEQEPEILRKIEWAEYGETVLHPVSLLLLVVMVIVLLRSRSTVFLIPFLIISTFITHMQRLVIGSLDFSMIRLLLIAALLRAIIRNDTHRFEWGKMDTTLIAYIVVLSMAYIALRQTGSAVVNRMGVAFEALLSFYLIRLYVQSMYQIVIFIRALSFVFFVVAFFMAIEQFTGHNYFSIFGGVPEITSTRFGRMRAQGAFSHPIMAGTFGAAFMPLFWGLKSIGAERDKRFALLGVVSSVVITWASSSSGPVLTLIAALCAVWVWNVRFLLNNIKILIVCMLIGLHIVMEAPVWHLISRIDIVGGSTGWHRYFLIDQTIHRFREWALLGVRTTGHWGWGLNDVTNMFIAQAVDGGLATFILFIVLVARGFKSVHIAIRNNLEHKNIEKFFWSWWAVLFAHCVSFFGVSYFGQMNYLWMLTLGIIACLPNLKIDYIPGKVNKAVAV